MYNIWNFQHLEKLQKAEYFQIYFISNLLSILPAQLTRCEIHRNRSILSIAENKIITICFGKELFNQFYFPSKATTTLLNLHPAVLLKQWNFSVT